MQRFMNMLNLTGNVRKQQNIKICVSILVQLIWYRMFNFYQIQEVFVVYILLDNNIRHEEFFKYICAHALQLTALTAIFVATKSISTDIKTLTIDD